MFKEKVNAWTHAQMHARRTTDHDISCWPTASGAKNGENVVKTWLKTENIMENVVGISENVVKLRWEKEKMLVTSIFSFSNHVFYLQTVNSTV